MTIKYVILQSCCIFSLSNPFSIVSHFSQQSNEWKLELDKNGIQVYTRQSDGSSIKEFKASTTVTSTMKPLETLIENVDGYSGWQVNVSSAKVLKRLDDSEQYIYYTTDAPWPVSDRDIVLNCKKNLEGDGAITYALVSKPEYIKEKKDFLRIKNAKGSWQFIPQKENKIKVTYQFYADPAGSIPDYIINTFIVNGPYDTLLNLKKRVEK